MNFRVNQSFEEANIRAEDRRINSHYIKERIFTHFHEKFKSNWQNDVNRDTARNGNGGNKLRRYKTFKTDYVVETVSERICFHCKTCMEDELHVLVDCPLYNEHRLKFVFSKVAG